MQKRERNNPILIYLNDKEIELLDMRCKENNESRSQIIRELIVFGFNYYVDYDKLTSVSHELILFLFPLLIGTSPCSGACPLPALPC